MRNWAILMAGIVFMSGCLIRTYTIEKPRGDTTVEGNRGYLMGEPSEGEEGESRLGKMRKITLIEIELGPHKPRDIKSKEQETKKPAVKEPEAEDNSVKESMTVARLDIDEEIVKEEEEDIAAGEVELKPQKEKEVYYVIQQNDTLQKIAHKFYGTTKKWEFLYKANKDVLKGPDKVYPGTKIKIPALK